MNRLLWFLSFMLLSASALASLQSDPVPASSKDGPRFEDRVRAFVKLEKQLEASLPAMASSLESERMIERRRALASALVAARRDAQQGDMFTPVVAARVRAILRYAFAGPAGTDIRRTIQEGDPPALPALRVNDLYPDNAPLVTMPPTLLRRLPALPMELAYRIVGRSLVLKDVETNVIVDVLPDAIPVVR